MPSTWKLHVKQALGQLLITIEKADKTAWGGVVIAGLDL
jgi:hypothetical protein